MLRLTTRQQWLYGPGSVPGIVYNNGLIGMVRVVEHRSILILNTWKKENSSFMRELVFYCLIDNVSISILLENIFDYIN